MNKTRRRKVANKLRMPMLTRANSLTSQKMNPKRRLHRNNYKKKEIIKMKNKLLYKKLRHFRNKMRFYKNFKMNNRPLESKVKLLR